MIAALATGIFGAPKQEMNFFGRKKGLDMTRRTVHQWRDWLLEYLGDGKYELIQKDTLAVVHTLTAENAMDAENACQQVIRTKGMHPQKE